MGVGTARRTAPADLRDAGAAVAVSALVLLGYLGISDLRIAGAFTGAIVLAIWGVVAFSRPRLALAASFPILLVAGTKFRTRDADASLAGVLDAQILLEIGLFAVIGVGLLGAWLATRDGRRASRAEVVIGLYAALALLSTLWSAAPALTFVRATQLAIVGGVAILGVRVLAPAASLWFASRAAAAHVVLCSSLAAVFPWAAGTFYYSEGFRFSWFAMHPIDAGTLAAIAALGAASLVIFGGSRHVPARLGVRAPLLVLALVAILLLTSSRGPLIGFIAAAGVLWLMRIHPAFRLSAGIVAVSLALAAVVFAPDLRGWLDSLASQNSAVSRAFFRGQTADTVLELNGRLGLWDDVKPAIVAQLLTGYGYQASRSVLLDAAPWAAYAHNAFLQTVLDLGVAGTVALVLLLAIGLSAAFQRALDPWTRATIAALMVFLALNSISTESFAGPPTFETLLLFICALCASGAAHVRVGRDLQVSPESASAVGDLHVSVRRPEGDRS